jgi:hypothetical protein
MTAIRIVEPTSLLEQFRADGYSRRQTKTSGGASSLRRQLTVTEGSPRTLDAGKVTAAADMPAAH